jgi:anti-sigma B factor antagonist
MHQVLILHENAVATVVARGEFDAFAAPELERALDGLGSAARVLVDLSSVAFLDSTALGCIVRASRACEERHALLRIVLPRGDARRIFEITTLDDALPVAESRQAALTELSG